MLFVHQFGLAINILVVHLIMVLLSFLFVAWRHHQLHFFAAEFRCEPLSLFHFFACDEAEAALLDGTIFGLEAGHDLVALNEAAHLPGHGLALFGHELDMMLVEFHLLAAFESEEIGREHDPGVFSDGLGHLLRVAERVRRLFSADDEVVAGADLFLSFTHTNGDLKKGVGDGLVASELHQVWGHWDTELFGQVISDRLAP